MSGLGDPFHLKILILFTSKPWESVVVDPRVLLGSPCLYPIGYLGYPEALLVCEPNGLCQGVPVAAPGVPAASPTVAPTTNTHA